MNQRERHHRLLAQHQHVERIVVFGEGLGDEAVVGGIVHGGVEHTIQLDQSADLVEFVLDARSEGDLDDAVELLRQFVAGGHVMPGMDHQASLEYRDWWHYIGHPDILTRARGRNRVLMLVVIYGGRNREIS